MVTRWKNTIREERTYELSIQQTKRKNYSTLVLGVVQLHYTGAYSGKITLRVLTEVKLHYTGACSSTITLHWCLEWYNYTTLVLVRVHNYTTKVFAVLVKLYYSGACSGKFPFRVQLHDTGACSITITLHEFNCEKVPHG